MNLTLDLRVARDTKNKMTFTSWDPLPLLGTNQFFNFTVVSQNTQAQRFLLNEPQFNFTAPNDAPPCEVYNFSVTATPNVDGTRYSGDGCSVHYSMRSVVLPSLPDITRLEMSLNYTLENSLEDGFELKVTYKVSCSTKCVLYYHYARCNK